MKEPTHLSAAERVQPVFDVGDYAVPINGKVLHCATMRYQRAVVASMSPFVLVSEAGDMVWSCTSKPEEFRKDGQAPSIVLRNVLRRVSSDAQECARLVKEMEDETAINDGWLESVGFEPTAVGSLMLTDGTHHLIFSGGLIRFNGREPMRTITTRGALRQLLRAIQIEVPK